MREELLEAVEELRRRPRNRPWFIPVRLEPCALPEIPIGPGEELSHLHYVDIFAGTATANVERLAASINRVLLDPAPRP